MNVTQHGYLITSDHRGKVRQISIEEQTFVRDYGSVMSGQIHSTAVNKNVQYLYVSDSEGN